MLGYVMVYYFQTVLWIIKIPAGSTYGEGH